MHAGNHEQDKEIKREVVEEVQVSVMVIILALISGVELVYCVEYYLYYRAGAGLEQTCHR